MEYSSLLFIYGFFPVSLVLFHLTPKKLKDVSLLLLSMVFCAFFGVECLLCIMAYVLVNYFLSRLTDKLRKSGAVACFIPFALCMMFDILTLFAFRTERFPALYTSLRLHEGFFPVGISLFTLSALGYLIDVYNGRVRSEKSIVRYSLYIMMFPRLLMGPVLRYDTFTRILKSRKFGIDELGKGLTLFIKGLAKKVLAADTLYALYIAVSSYDTHELSAVTAWLGITAYILCLYFTLSGVADMGVGIGYCFGFRFPQSFNYPMFSSRIRYFAAKWHIQVVHWFRNYITKPFTSSVRSRYIRKLIFIGAWTAAGCWYTFTLGGAIWGALMGTAIVIEGRLRKSRMLKATGIIYTFLLVTVFSVFLASGTVSDGLAYLLAMIGGNRSLTDGLTVYLLRSYLVVLLVTMYASTDLFRNMLVRSRKQLLRKLFSALTPAVMVLLLAVCTALMSSSGSSCMQLLRL